MVLFEGNTFHNVEYYHERQLAKKNEISKFSTANVIHLIDSENKLNGLQSIEKESNNDKSKASNLQRNFNETCSKSKRDNG